MRCRAQCKTQTKTKWEQRLAPHATGSLRLQCICSPPHSIQSPRKELPNSGASFVLELICRRQLQSKGIFESSRLGVLAGGSTGETFYCFRCKHNCTLQGVQRIRKRNQGQYLLWPRNHFIKSARATRAAGGGGGGGGSGGQWVASAVCVNKTPSCRVPRATLLCASSLPAA